MSANDVSAVPTSPTMPLIYDSEPALSSSIHNNLSSSVPSLSSSRSQASQIAKTYRQAANLFLTRRLPEALSTIEPIIIPQPQDEDLGNGDHQSQPLAPIALASRSSRIKVWVFWLTFLSAVVELGPEEGKHAFGTNKWKTLVSKARDGTVWEDIVQDGYGGAEGNVDAEVVVNLATLLLAHAPSQQLNQTRLEAYLSAVAHPTFDIATHLSSPPRIRRTSSTPGTNTPRDLQLSLKLLELYTLHVLPRNGEWDYAREFIMMSELLDDERKEVFLQALHELKEEKQQAAAREKEIQRQQEEQILRQKREEEEEIRRVEARRAEDEIRRREESKRQHRQPANHEGQPRDGHSRPKALGPPRPAGGTASRPRAEPKKDIARRSSANQTLYGRIGAIVTNLQSLLLTTAQSLRTNPLLLLRTVLFILAFALAFGRRAIRVRIKRTLERAWLKVKGTAGMGLKVSSI